MRLLRNWAIVYAGNVVGVLTTAVLLFATRHATFSGSTRSRPRRC